MSNTQGEHPVPQQSLAKGSSGGSGKYSDGSSQVPGGESSHPVGSVGEENEVSEEVFSRDSRLEGSEGSAEELCGYVVSISGRDSLMSDKSIIFS